MDISFLRECGADAIAANTLSSDERALLSHPLTEADVMAKRHPHTTRRENGKNDPAQTARGRGQKLSSSKVGALPIVNRILKRMRLEELLEAYLPAQDRRAKIPAARGLLVLLENLLFSREPLYGLGNGPAATRPTSGD